MVNDLDMSKAVTIARDEGEPSLLAIKKFAGLFNAGSHVHAITWRPTDPYVILALARNDIISLIAPYIRLHCGIYRVRSRRDF
jgi:hypothetical protein